MTLLRDRPAGRPDVEDARRSRRLAARLLDKLTAPVDAASLAIVRMGVGAMIGWEVWREIDSGLLRADYIEPEFNFKWSLFQWVDPLPELGMFVVMGVLAAAALCVATGLFYRVAAVVQFLGITYWFLLAQERYLNHRYLACVLAFLLILVPAHSAYSMDAWRKPWLRTRTIPAWSLWLFRLQIGIPYFVGGIAKLNFDWLARNEPLAMWLRDRMDFPVIGRYFADDSFVRLMAWGSTLLDLTVVFLMLRKRTRVVGYGMAVLFHFMNSRLFNIGIFPWTMIVVTTVFFEPDWPRQMVAALRRGSLWVRGAMVAGYALGFYIGGALPKTFSPIRALIGGFGVAVIAFHLLPARVREAASFSAPTGDASPWRRFTFGRRLAWFLVVWTACQLLIPFRHFAIPGNAHWTDEGNRFSWHMLLREKLGNVAFVITDPSTGQEGTVELRDHLTNFQIFKMQETPDMFAQFSHYFEDLYQRRYGYGDLEIRLDSVMSLNGRIPQQFVDPDFDLTTAT
ncbi:MAG: HTTM domain-containing protein, partial [Actinomycetota bacterium]